MSVDGPKTRGLKRLSLTPGASAIAQSPRTPTSAGVGSGPESPLPSPLLLNHGRRHAPKRMSSISYYNSAVIASSSASPTSSTSETFIRSPPPPTIPELSTTVSLRGSDGLRRASSLPKRTRAIPSTVPEHKPSSSSSDFVIPAQPAASAPAAQTLVEK